MTVSCTHLDYALNLPAAPTVGVVVLQTDEVLEDELRHWLTPGTRVLHSRIPNDTTVNADTLGAMEAALPASLNLLPKAAPVSVLAYGCTSGTTVIGEARVKELVHQVFPGVAVTNPLTALKAKLNDLSAKRIALLTPYEPKVSQALYDHLTDEGFEVVSFGSFNEPLDTNVCRIDEASISQAVEALHAQAECDAVFASCTNLRTSAWLDEFSAQLGTPVISSNSAMSWHINTLTSNA